MSPSCKRKALPMQASTDRSGAREGKNTTEKIEIVLLFQSEDII